MFIKNHMQEALAIRADMTLGSAIDLMERHRQRLVPVVNECGRLIGALSDRDVWWTVCELGEGALRRTVDHVMDPSPITIHVSAHMEDALQLFALDEEPEVILVVEADRLAGLLTRQHALCAVARMMGFDRVGSRVDVALLNGKDDLAAAFAVLRDSPVDMISATAGFTRDDGADPVLSIRLAQAESRLLERGMAQAGLLLLVPEREWGLEADGNGNGSAHVCGQGNGRVGGLAALAQSVGGPAEL